jgi:peptide/nickel transport system substrate-binding protein
MDENMAQKFGRRPVWAAAIASLAVVGLLTSCSSGGSASSSSSGGANRIVTAETGQAGQFVDNFNPFSPNAQRPTLGMIYEPLMYFNIAKAGTPQPWLAKSFAWSNGGKTLTFTMRSDAKWTDGTAVTAADVAYTFNLLKSNPALNSAGLPIASASTTGTDTAVVNFTKSSYTDIDYIAGSTYILPQHVWSKISNPTTTLNAHPVGSGAYTVSSVTGEALTLKANPNYYMSGLPKVKTYRFLYFNGNQASNLAIESGQVDWANSYIPNINTVYKSKNSKFVVSNTPVAITSIVPNFADPTVSQLAVRQAVSYAINRTQVSKVVYNGYANPVPTSGLISPNFDNVADPTLKDTKFAFDVSKAKSTLESAGYTLGSNGFFAKNGTELTLTVQVPSGYTDYVQALQIIVQELKTAGINLVVQGESVNAWTSNFYNGKFQLLMTYQGFTSSPYVYYKTIIGSDGLPPVGQEDTAGNQGRYNNPQVDSLLQTIASTDDTATQKPSFYKIQQIFAKDLPVIPLFQQQNEGTFNGNHITGFPTPQNPYASSGQQQPNVGWVAMHIAPVK